LGALALARGLGSNAVVDRPDVLAVLDSRYIIGGAMLLDIFDTLKGGDTDVRKARGLLLRHIIGWLPGAIHFWCMLIGAPPQHYELSGSQPPLTHSKVSALGIDRPGEIQWVLVTVVLLILRLDPELTTGPLAIAAIEYCAFVEDDRQLLTVRPNTSDELVVVRAIHQRKDVRRRMVGHGCGRAGIIRHA
jgi:hypothetical protein